MIEIKSLDKNSAELLHEAFNKIGWVKPFSLFERYIEEQNAGTREVLVAYCGAEVAGYGTIVWQSLYPYFAGKNIPEINDLNVLPSFRGKGIATSLMNKFEALAVKNYDTVGIGFGLYKDYGTAQNLYIKRGYLPNKEGITYNYKNVIPGQSYRVDDDLVLWFTKRLSV